MFIPFLSHLAHDGDFSPYYTADSLLVSWLCLVHLASSKCSVSVSGIQPVSFPGCLSLHQF